MALKGVQNILFVYFNGHFSLLSQCSPPLEVKDLLVDIKDGKILMALLEVLSGQNLVCGCLFVCF